jgi:hypothetical protein
VYGLIKETVMHIVSRTLGTATLGLGLMAPPASAQQPSDAAQVPTFAKDVAPIHR